MLYYMIVHVPTGDIFPQVIAKRGQTGIDFLPRDHAAPRLWRHRGRARAWLTVYCQGEQRAAYDEECERMNGNAIVPGTSRPRAEYAVVAVRIDVVEQPAT